MQIVLHVLVLLASSRVLAMLIVLYVADGPSEAYAVSMVPATTTFEKLWQIGHLMVPLRSAGPMNMYGTILAPVGRLGSSRSTEATSLHVCLEAHVLVLCATCHVLAVETTSQALAMEIVWLAPIFPRIACR